MLGKKKANLSLLRGINVNSQIPQTNLPVKLKAGNIEVQYRRVLVLILRDFSHSSDIRNLKEHILNMMATR